MLSTSERAVAPALMLAPPGSVTIQGLLGEALEANRAGRLSSFIVDEASPAIAIFAPERVAANEQGDWYGEHAGKWLVAATLAATRSGDTALLARAGHVADWLITQQDADGYLGTYAPTRRFMRRQPDRPPSWDGAPALRTWDIWTHAYLMLGLIELHRATHADRYLAAAKRIGNLCADTLLDGGIAITDLGNHFGLSASVLIDPAIELYFATGEQRYVELAHAILDQLEAEPANRLVSQAIAGADPSEIATGKAYQLLWNMVGITKLFRATGEARLLTAVLNVWQGVREHHLTLGGGPWGGVAHRSREVFNAPGSFDPEAYVETCSTMAWIQLNRELLRITGEARFAEEIERSAYNDLLGAQAPNGEDWCYYSFANGRRVHTTYWRCCKSSGAIALEELPAVAFGVTQGGEIAINLLGPASAVLDVPGTGAVQIEVDTRYPLEGRIEIKIDPPVPLLFRVPQWAEGATLSGSNTPLEAGEYARIEAAHYVCIDLPMKPRRHRRSLRNLQQSLAPDGLPVEQEVLRHDFMAFTRGPLVYATGLIEGYRPVETIMPDTAIESTTDFIMLPSPRDALPIRLEPYFGVGGRRDGTWRLTWFRLPPEQAA